MDYLTRKFITVMKREVNLRQEVDGKAGLREIKQNISRKFRLDSNDVTQVALELKKRNLICTERKRKRRIGVNI